MTNTRVRRPVEQPGLEPKTVYQIVGGACGLGLVIVILTAIFSGPNRATITGRVLFQGRPVIWGQVVVVGPDGRTASGFIEPDGSYKVENAPPGAVNVGVISRDPLLQTWATNLKTTRDRPTSKVFSASPVNRQQWFPLPKQYEEPANSGVTILITSGKNESDIVLP